MRLPSPILGLPIGRADLGDRLDSLSTYHLERQLRQRFEPSVPLLQPPWEK